MELDREKQLLDEIELLPDPDAAKKPMAAGSANLGPAAETPPSRQRKGPRPPRIPEHLPVDEETLEPDFVLSDPTAWGRIGEEVTEQLDYRPGRFLRHWPVRPKYVHNCDPLARFVLATLPPSLQDRCTATARLIAEVVTNGFAHHLPYYRQAEIIDNNGTENAIRPTKLGAKNWMFIGSGEAGQKTAILYTIVENCRGLGIAPAESHRYL